MKGAGHDVTLTDEEPWPPADICTSKPFPLGQGHISGDGDSTIREVDMMSMLANTCSESYMCVEVTIATCSTEMSDASHRRIRSQSRHSRLMKGLCGREEKRRRDSTRYCCPIPSYPT